MAGLFSLDLGGAGRPGLGTCRPVPRTFIDSARFRVDPGTRVTTHWRDGCLLMHVESLRTCALNAVGSRVWSLVEGGRTLDEMVGVLAEEYEATASLIKVGVRSFLSDLLSKGFIVDVDAESNGRLPRTSLRG